MARIISASRRTDIPRFYPEFFAERRRAGSVVFRNVFGVEGIASLRDEDVLGYLFWTRFARPFSDNLRALRDGGIAHVFQYTITGYGEDLEPDTPGTEAAIEDFRSVSADLPDPACIQWRYDPLVVSDTYDVAWHLENFTRIAGHLAGATRVVNVSLIEPYKKTIRRVDDATVVYRQLDPIRHRWAARNRPNLRQAGRSVRQLLVDLAEIASQHELELRACANPDLGLPVSQCCGAEMFAPCGERLERTLADLSPRPSRENCHCLESVDIGMDNTCPAGCKYCYVLVSRESAVANFERHDAAGESLR
jgi:hypothetical protein